jgi:ribosomal protein L22
MSADETPREDEAVEGETPTEGETPAEEPTAEASAEAETSAEPEAPAEEPQAEEKPKPKRTRAKKADAEAKPAEDEPKAEKQPKAAEKPKRARKASTQPEPPKAAPRNGRKADPAVTVRAQAKYVRSSARKARLVSEHLPGKTVADARTVLALSPRSVAQDWSKVLESAIANAENNHELIGDELTVWRAYADEGPTLKRFRPRAMGRATRIRKRTSHLTILLAPKATKE